MLIPELLVIATCNELTVNDGEIYVYKPNMRVVLENISPGSSRYGPRAAGAVQKRPTTDFLQASIFLCIELGSHPDDPSRPLLLIFL